MASITINSNIAALNAQRRLATSTAGLRDTFAALSSGLRINKASDDAAGLAISSSLNVDHRVYNQGIRNLNDGMSLLAIADGAMEQLENIAIRLTELAEQSANGALRNTQRKALDSEAQALKNEFSRISQSTRFNGLTLLSGSLGEVRLQTGFGESAILQSNLGGAVGTGQFQSPATAYTGNGGANNIETADFNGDGLIDILTYGTGINGAASVALGDGQGGFTAVFSALVTGVGTQSAAAVGDLNNDGILDLMAAGSSGIRVLLGNGNGTFRLGATYGGGLFAVYGANLSDLNNDGYLDFSYTGADPTDEAETIVILGNGNGTFQADRTFHNWAGFGTTDAGYSIQYGDINGDGILDMLNGIDIAANSGGYIVTRLGDGKGGFGALRGVSLFDVDGYSAAFADFNGDGKLDYVQVGRVVDYGIAQVGFGNGDGTFRAPVSYSLSDSFPNSSLAIADFDGDGILDLASDTVVILGNGNGTFRAPLTRTEVSGTSDIAAADVNGDGALDILSIRSTGSVSYFKSETTTGVAPILDFSLQTLSGARQALPLFKQKLDQLTKQRGKIGAFQSRIQSALANASTISLNVAAAASQISSADVAEESAKLVKQQILQRAGAAVLAQANQGPALALRLLNIQQR